MKDKWDGEINSKQTILFIENEYMYIISEKLLELIGIKRKIPTLWYAGVEGTNDEKRIIS